LGCEKTSFRLEHTILGKTATEKPRNTEVQTRSDKEAAVSIKMAIIDRRHPDVKLDQTQVDMIQVKLPTAVDASLSGETPLQFLNSKFAQGVFWITCAFEPSKTWLMRTISGLGELW
jgi:hypothetical protein